MQYVGAGGEYAGEGDKARVRVEEYGNILRDLLLLLLRLSLKHSWLRDCPLGVFRLALERCTASLLHDVRELVRKQPPTLKRPRRKPARVKNNLLPYRICVGIHILRRLSGGRAGIHLHATEVMPEPWLHECSCRSVERLAWRAQDFVDDGRGFGLF